MRYPLAGLVGLCLLAASLCGALASEWQDAVADLAAERTRAVTCVRALIEAGDKAGLAHGALVYGQAKAEVDGVLAGLQVVLADGGAPDGLADLTGRLRRGFEAREALCRLARTLSPPDATDSHKNLVIDTLKVVIDPLVAAVSTLYQDHRADERLRRETIANSLEATRWPAFSEITP